MASAASTSKRAAAKARSTTNGSKVSKASVKRDLEVESPGKEAVSSSNKENVVPNAAVASSNEIFRLLKEKRLKMTEGDEADGVSAVSPDRDIPNFEKYNIKPKVSSPSSVLLRSKQKGFGIHVAVIKNEGFVIRFDNYKVQKCLNDLIWKYLKEERMNPMEKKIMDDLLKCGLFPRTFTWIQDGEVQKTYFNTQVKLFLILTENTSGMTKLDMVGFFTDLCSDFINQLPVSLEHNITTSVDPEGFLWNENACYADLIGSEAAMSRFKYEVQDMEEIANPSGWFEDNKETVFKYFSPGSWTIEVLMLFQPSSFDDLLAPSELEKVKEMALFPTSSGD
jgi:hypothetical protein